MNLGGYQNNLGPWNMQGGGVHHPPSWWQGHNPSEWQNNQTGWPMPGQMPPTPAPGAPPSAPPVATTTSPGQPGGEGGFDLRGLIHTLTGGTGNLEQLFQNGIPNAGSLFGSMLHGGVQAPNVQTMFGNLIGGMKDGSITRQNSTPSMGNIIGNLSGMGMAGQQPAGQPNTPSAYNQGAH